MPDRNVSQLIDLVNTNYQKYAKTFTISEIVKLLKKLSDAYYNEEPLVPDLIYDELRELLEEKDPENPYLEEIGAPVKGTKNKVKLPYEMGSLKKVKPSTGKLEKWLEKYDSGSYVISDKLDGVSVQLYKNNDGKVLMLSRGKSTEGQDVSHLIQYVVKKEIIQKMTKGMSIRGELVISKKNFQKIKSYMKNPRNAVAGLINSKTVNVQIAKLSTFVAYSILNPKYLQSEQMKILEKLDIDVVSYKIVKNLDEDFLKEYLIKRRKESAYEIDGIVVVDNSQIYQQTGGFPDHMFAFKMILEDQIAITEIIEILWNVSMDGYAKPRIRIKPVELLGTTVTYATAFNAKYIVDNVLGAGAKIKIIRSNDVIPYILEVIKLAKSKKPDMPKFKYKWNETKVDIIADTDSDEIKQMINIKLIIHFFSTLKVKYLGEGIVNKLVDAGYDTISKILKAKSTDLYNIEGMGEKMVKKIYNEILRALNEADLASFMDASHCFGRGMGTKKLEEVVNMYPNILTQDWSKDEMKEKILEVPMFANKSAELFVNNFDKFKKFYNEISKIVDLSRFKELDEIESDTGSESEEEEKLLSGKKIVFTGFRDNELEKCIKKNGGKISGSVSKNTDMLVYKDGADTSSSKFLKASELGTKLITKSEFTKKYCS